MVSLNWRVTFLQVNGTTEKCRVLEWGDIEWLKVRTQQWVRQATGSGGGIQSHKLRQDPGGVCKPERLGMELVPGTGSPTWLLVSPPLGKDHSVPSVTLHQPAGGRYTDNACWKAGQVDAGINTQPGFYCSSAACLHRLAGSVSTHWGGKEANPNRME